MYKKKYHKYNKPELQIVVVYELFKTSLQYLQYQDLRLGKSQP